MIKYNFINFKTVHYRTLFVRKRTTNLQLIKNFYVFEHKVH